MGVILERACRRMIERKKSLHPRYRNVRVGGSNVSRITRAVSQMLHLTVLTLLYSRDSIGKNYSTRTVQRILLVTNSFTFLKHARHNEVDRDRQ